MYKEITERLHDNDVHMVKCYLSNVRSDIDVRYIFAPGDYVLLRRRGGHKLSKQADGPYRFVKYNGKPPRRFTAVVARADGSEQIVSLTNLLPLYNDAPDEEVQPMMPVRPERKRIRLLPGHGRAKQGVKRARSEGSWEGPMKTAAPDPPEKKLRTTAQSTKVRRKPRRPPCPRR